MEYIRSRKYDQWMNKIMGPNPIKLTEELMQNHAIPVGARVCDLGSGQGLTSIFLAREYGLTVYAADLWSDPEENRRFFESAGAANVIPVKADTEKLPFERDFSTRWSAWIPTTISGVTKRISMKSCCRF